MKNSADRVPDEGERSDIKNTSAKESAGALFGLLVKLCCAAGVSLLLLCGFVLVYFNSGVHIDNKDGSTDYKWLPGQLKTTMTEGFAFLRMDENGFNNLPSDHTEINVLLMGSSQMEAINIPQDKNAASVLNTLIQPAYCYNIGVSGHTAYTCFKNVRQALEVWRPTDYAVIVIDTVALDRNDMRSVLDGTYKKIPSYDQGLLYTLQRYVPAVKALYKDLEDWRDADQKAASAPAGAAPAGFAPDEAYVQVLTEFITLFYTAARDAGVTPVLLYLPPTEIDAGGDLIYADGAVKDVFARVCADVGVTFADMTDAFSELYRDRHILAYGFANGPAGKGHLNAYGHRAVAEKLAEVIRGHAS